MDRKWWQVGFLEAHPQNSVAVTAVAADQAAVAVELRCYPAAAAAEGAVVVVAAADHLSLAWEQVVEVLD